MPVRQDSHQWLKLPGGGCAGHALLSTWETERRPSTQSLAAGRAASWWLARVLADICLVLPLPGHAAGLPQLAVCLHDGMGWLHRFRRLGPRSWRASVLTSRPGRSCRAATLLPLPAWTSTASSSGGAVCQAPPPPPHRAALPATLPTCVSICAAACHAARLQVPPTPTPTTPPHHHHHHHTYTHTASPPPPPPCARIMPRHGLTPIHRSDHPAHSPGTCSPPPPPCSDCWTQEPGQRPPMAHVVRRLHALLQHAPQGEPAAAGAAEAV